MLQKKSSDVGLSLLPQVEVTSESESVDSEKGSLNSFVQREFNLVQKWKIRQMTINEYVKDRDAMKKDVCRLIYAIDLLLTLWKLPYTEGIGVSWEL